MTSTEDEDDVTVRCDGCGREEVIGLREAVRLLGPYYCSDACEERNAPVRP